MADSSSGLDLSSILGGLSSLAGAGLAASNQQGYYNNLQNALNVIGPTQLNPYSLTGPGGMSSGYNANGGANIDLGSLSGAFGNLVNGGTGGAAAYSPGLLSGLTSAANGTLNPALSTLNGAYSGNNNYQNLAAQQAAGLGSTYSDIYNNTLTNMRAQAAPAIQQQAYGLQNTLFGSGVVDSTGAASGSLAAQNFGRGVAQGDASMQLAAQQAALSGMQGQASIANTLSNTGNSLLSNAFANFGNTNQLISGLNTTQLNNSLQALQGAGALNTLGLNNYMAALQTGATQATARNQALFPYANVALGLSNTPNAQALLSGGLSSVGSSLLGSNGLSGLFNNLFGGNSSTGSGLLGNLFGSGLTTGGALGTDAFSSGAAANSALSDAGFGFSSAGGQAAAGTGSAASGLSSAAAGAGAAGLGALGAFGSGAAANGAVASGLGGTIGSELGGTSADIAASNAAALGGASSGAGAAAGSSAAGASGGAAAGSALAGIGTGVGVMALPFILGSFMSSHDTGGYNLNYLNSLGSAVKQGTAQYGPLNLNSAMGSTIPLDFTNYASSGGMSPQESQAMDSVAQLYAESGSNAYARQLLNSMGYATAPSNTITSPAPGGHGWFGGSSVGAARV